jgi:hypothetical protein
VVANDDLKDHSWQDRNLKTMINTTQYDWHKKGVKEKLLCREMRIEHSLFDTWFCELILGLKGFEAAYSRHCTTFH